MQRPDRGATWPPVSILSAHGRALKRLHDDALRRKRCVSILSAHGRALKPSLVWDALREYYGFNTFGSR